MFESVKALILDCDGLLVDSEPWQFEARNMAAEKFGHILSEKDFLYFWFDGNGGAKAFCAHYGFPVEKYQKIKHALYGQFVDEKMSLCEGVKKFLEAVHGKYKVALCSNSGLRDIEHILNHFGVKDFFEVIVAGEDIKRGKPAPDGFLAAAKKLGVTPDEALVFENSHIGLAAAKAAGMKCMMVPDLYGRKFQFSAADKILAKIDDALELLEILV